MYFTLQLNVHTKDTSEQKSHETHSPLAHDAFLYVLYYPCCFSTSHKPLFETTNLIQTTDETPPEKPYQACFSKQGSHQQHMFVQKVLRY